MVYRVSNLRNRITIDVKNSNKKIGITFDIKKQRIVWCINREDEIDKRVKRKKKQKGLSKPYWKAFVSVLYQVRKTIPLAPRKATSKGWCLPCTPSQSCGISKLTHANYFFHAHPI